MNPAASPESEPAVDREDLLRGVGEVLDHEEVLDLVAPAVECCGELRLVLLEPLEHAGRTVELVEGMEARIGETPIEIGPVASRISQTQ